MFRCSEHDSFVSECIDCVNVNYNRTKQLLDICAKQEFHQRTVDLPMWRERVKKVEAECKRLRHEILGLLWKLDVLSE